MSFLDEYQYQLARSTIEAKATVFQPGKSLHVTQSLGNPSLHFHIGTGHHRADEIGEGNGRRATLACRKGSVDHITARIAVHLLFVDIQFKEGLVLEVSGIISPPACSIFQRPSNSASLVSEARCCNTRIGRFNDLPHKAS